MAKPGVWRSCAFLEKPYSFLKKPGTIRQYLIFSRILTVKNQKKNLPPYSVHLQGIGQGEGNKPAQFLSTFNLYFL